MDSNALVELIAEVRETIATLAEAEQKIGTVKAELAKQDHRARLAASSDRSIKPIAARANSGWLPAA
jgi:hypothetical protein